MTDLDLVAWVRRDGPPTATAEGRPLGSVRMTVTDSVHARAAEIAFAQPGPDDVDGLLPGAVHQVVPAPGDLDAEEEHCPYVELAAEDLPWRYGLARGGVPQPWCVLVVGTPADVVVQGNQVLLRGAALADHDLDLAARWAHVQRPRGGGAGSGFARVLSPAPLAAQTDYVAALVVPWRRGEKAWSGPAPAPVTVPCLHSWTFRTGLPGGFETLAGELRPADDDPVGTVTVVLPSGVEVSVPGALTSLDFSLDPPDPDGPEVDLDLLTGEDTGAGGRRLVQPPAYGAAWRGRVDVLADLGAAAGSAPATWPWTAQVNGDLRLRVLAGVGLQAGIDLQEQVVDAAQRQWGAGRLAHDLLSAVRLGLEATHAQWGARLPSTTGGRLALLGPAAHRLPVDDVGQAATLAGALASPAPDAAAFPVGLLSSRVARAVGRGRLRDAGGEESLVRLAAEGLPDPERPAEQPGHLVGLGARAEADTGGAVTAEEVDRALVGATDRLECPFVLAEPEAPTVRRPDPDRIGDLLVDALHPGRGESSSAGRRVVDRLGGIDTEGLAAPLDTPDLDLPVWPYLRDVVPHWLLPGADSLGPGEVVALRSCPEFVEAFLLGLNHRALAELAWRQHPVRPACTPLRRFWDHAPADGTETRGPDDITDVLQWPPGSRLGSHAPSGVRPDKLVVVVRSELFRRYPRTLLFLAPSTVPTPTWARGTADLARALMPQFVAGMDLDLTMFAFDVAPETVRTHWVVVQEMPEGIRFTRDRAGDQVDGGSWAAANLDTPLRVLLPGPDVVGVHEGDPA